jgi:hypothetical protein
MLSLTLAMLFAGNAVAQNVPVKPDPPKAGGAYRIGLVTPRVSLLGGGGTVQQETVQLNKNISSFLTGPKIGTVDLRAKLDSLAQEEGKERGCDYVLYVSLIRKRPTAPRGSGASFGGGGGTKTGDEFTFEYKVVPTDGSAGPTGKTHKATVSADGEDVLTPMIEAMAQVVVALVKAKPPTLIASASPSPEVNTEPAATSQPSSTPARTPTPRPATGYGSLTERPKSATPARGADPPKAEGTIRIGIATPRVTYIGGGMSGNTDAASLRETLASYLVGSNIETIELKARLEQLTLTEAQKRECDLVLYTTLQRKRTSSNKGGGLDSIMGTVSGGGVGSKIPGAKTTQQIGSEAAKVSGAIASVARANDEITFEFRLMSSDGVRQLAGSNTKAKVKKDGEDVLTPMIESAAQAIVDATVKK